MDFVRLKVHLCTVVAPPASEWKIGDRLLRKADGDIVELSVSNILVALTFLSGRLRVPVLSDRDPRFIAALERNYVWDSRP